MSDTEQGCIIPLAQAGAIGLLSALFTLALAMWRGWPGPGWLALGVGAIAALITFVTGVLAWRQAAGRPGRNPGAIATVSRWPAIRRAIR